MGWEKSAFKVFYLSFGDMITQRKRQSLMSISSVEPQKPFSEK
jgi:hypothetical protein